MQTVQETSSLVGDSTNRNDSSSPARRAPRFEMLHPARSTVDRLSVAQGTHSTPERSSLFQRSLQGQSSDSRSYVLSSSKGAARNQITATDAQSNCVSRGQGSAIFDQQNTVGRWAMTNVVSNRLDDFQNIGSIGIPGPVYKVA